jgi:hypothetical protein
MRSYRQWKTGLISGSLFSMFLGFVVLANFALYFYKSFDPIARFLGIGLGTNLAFFISTVFLFVWVKNLTAKTRMLERKLERFVREDSLEKVKLSK